MSGPRPAASADVIVVGAGPGGSATANHLAKAGLSVILLEKSQFPREKVCGDGLTPRAVKEMALLGIDLGALGWKRSRGLRIHVGRRQYLMGWPELMGFPAYGLTAPRSVFDQFMAEQAAQAGARLVTGANVTAAILRRERVVGVTTKDGRSFEAPVVVAADGSSARLAVTLGLNRMESRALGIAVRTYFRSPMADEDWLDSWLELWDGAHLLPGYGWSFPLGDGLCNVGLGLPDAKRYHDLNLRDLLGRWLATTPASWGFRPANQVGVVRSAALPMGFNRKPVVYRGLLLVGDCAGAINPFTGEGISYALESGRWAAEAILDARSRGVHTRAADKALAGYAARLTSEWGGYYWLGSHFQRIIAHPAIMRVAAHYGLPIPAIRTLVHRTLSHLVDRPSRDGYDRVVNALSALAPKA